MTTIRFISGLREIGGTFIEVESARAKCMFDFGFSNTACMDPRIRLRKESCAADYISLGILPKTGGIYEKDTASAVNVRPYTSDASGKECFLLISHMHIDHMGGLCCLHPDVPVYVSEDSLTLYRALFRNGEAGYREHTNMRGVSFHAPFTAGDMTIEAIPVDHDVIGACGFLISTPDGTIAYTGDFRFHGFHPALTEAFAERAKGADVLITEGVSVSHEEIDVLSLTAPDENKRTEETLQEEIKELLLSDERLFVINVYQRNVERVMRLADTAKEAGRTLVVDDRMARILHAFDPDRNLTIYAETLSEQAGKSPLPSSWTTVTASALIKNPGAYLLQSDFSDLYALIALKEVTAAYLHADGAPLGDYDPAYAVLRHTLETLEIPFRQISTGGHAEPYYLRFMADEIAPKVLVPVHSFRPEQVKSKQAGRIFLPEKNDILTLPLEG